MSFKMQSRLLYAFCATIGVFFVLISMIVFPQAAADGCMSIIMGLALLGMNHVMYLTAKVLF